MLCVYSFYYLCYTYYSGDSMIVKRYNDSYFDEVNWLLNEAFNVNKSGISSHSAYEFVALDNDEVVGYFILNEMIDVVRNVKFFHVDYVCVSLMHRRRGVGRLMMEYAEIFAKENGGKYLELTSGFQREDAHKLYLSIGFIKRDSAIFRKELV